MSEWIRMDRELGRLNFALDELRKVNPHEGAILPYHKGMRQLANAIRSLQECRMEEVVWDSHYKDKQEVTP
jgi:hypothetical protein